MASDDSPNPFERAAQQFKGLRKDMLRMLELRWELARAVAEGETLEFLVTATHTDPDTPGGRLRAAQQGETFMFSPSGGELTRLCNIEEFDLTAHANRDDMLEFVGRLRPRVVLLTHGDDQARAWFDGQIRSRYPAIQVLQPKPGETLEV